MTVTSTGGEVTDALSGKLTFEQSKNRIVGRDEDNLARLLILADGNEFVMKVSKDSKNVLTAPDNDLIFNSNNNLFKIVGSGTATTSTFAINGTAGQWNASNNSGPDVIAHGLGYTPAVLAFTNFGGGQYGLMPATFTQIVSTTAIYFEIVSVTANSTSLYLTDLVRSNGAVSATGGGHSIKYYLLQESAV